MNEYAIGNTVRVVSDFTTVATGSPVDPSTVTVTIRDPTGAENVYTYAASQVVKDSTGDYHYDVIGSIAGVWCYYWLGVGTSQAAAERYFRVLPSRALVG